MRHLQLFLGFVDIVETNHMRVIDQLHDSNLALNASVHRRTVGQRGLGDDLDRNLLIRPLMASQLDAACGTDSTYVKRLKRWVGIRCEFHNGKRALNE